jgi:hypothetical protein
MVFDDRIDEHQETSTPSYIEERTINSTKKSSVKIIFPYDQGEKID